MSTTPKTPTPAPLPPWLRWAVVGSVLVAIGLGAFWQYGQPQRQVHVHTERLLQAVEGREWERVESLFAETYADAWGFDKQTALSYGQQVFGQFLRLRIRPQELQVQISSEDRGRATVWFVIEGSGGPLANLTRDQVNALQQPFQFDWQRSAGNPYRWQLIRIENPDLEIPEINHVHKGLVMVADAKILLSPADHLDFEAKSSIKHDYIDGEVFALEGTTDTHNLIVGNCFILLRTQLRRSQCRTFFADIKARIEARNCFYYPDLLVTCDPRDQETQTYKRFPCLIIEVSSESTEAFDRGNKFNDYQALETLKIIFWSIPSLSGSSTFIEKQGVGFCKPIPRDPLRFPV